MSIVFLFLKQDQSIGLVLLAMHFLNGGWLVVFLATRMNLCLFFYLSFKRSIQLTFVVLLLFFLLFFRSLFLSSSVILSGVFGLSMIFCFLHTHTHTIL